MLLGETNVLLPQAPYWFRPTPLVNFPGQTQATASVPQAFSLSPSLCFPSLLKPHSLRTGTVLNDKAKLSILLPPVYILYKRSEFSG